MAKQPGASSESAHSVEATGLTPYLWVLLAMLVSATIFDGFDIAILSAVAPVIQREHGLTHGDWGLINTIVRLGAVVSFFVLMLADRYGRRRLITITILGYACFTGLTACSWDIQSFTFFQFGARIFLASEFALALIIIGEEYPTRWRSMGIALLSGVIAVGTIVAYQTAGYVLAHYDWRTMYLLGLIPLALVFFFRLGMRETRRFEQIKETRSGSSWAAIREGLRAPFRPAYRKRALLVTLIWNCTHLITAPAVTFWTIHASTNLGFTALQYGQVVSIGYFVALFCGAPVAGILMNRIGRRLTCAGFYLLASLFVFLLFHISIATITVQAVLMSATVSCFLGAHAVTATYATELFPTEIRATGYSWTTNLFGRITEVTAPFLIGVFADDIGIPNAVGLTAIGPLLGAIVVFRYAPETRGKTLEEINA